MAASCAPLRDRVFASSSSDTCYSTLSKGGPVRPLQYKDWTPDAMKAAMKAVIKHGVSIREAAQMHQIPKSTLGDRDKWKSASWSNKWPILLFDECRRGRPSEFSMQSSSNRSRPHSSRSYSNCRTNACIPWQCKNSQCWLVGLLQQPSR